MGICSSYESTAVATAKIIRQDGTLEEIPCPNKVSYALIKNPNCFICNSDDMEFDEFILAINGDADLLPGHLYFALPMSWLKYPIGLQEMASLVVKASLALDNKIVGGLSWGCCPKGVEPVVFLGTQDHTKPSRMTANDGGGGDDSERLLVKMRQEINSDRSGGGGSSGPRRRSASKLSVVLEE